MRRACSEHVLTHDARAYARPECTDGRTDGLTETRSYLCSNRLVSIAREIQAKSDVVAGSYPQTTPAARTAATQGPA